ncbi:uncharacterized protein CDAR_313831 [Caerostris darwini]|uniref:Uncharacterized protein n=1 Tax=Caerostris darwini TaxID=1538125 RepID=A0AAV4N3N5_9ARAC|nr:uncharacterized protein CDAR_313831 [Caerostris darwini]
MSYDSNFQEDDISINIKDQNLWKADVSICNSSSKDKVFLLMLTNTNDFKVYPTSGIIKGKSSVSVIVDRLTEEREAGLAVLVKDFTAKDAEGEDCWHCIFENDTSQKHLFPLKIQFHSNRLGNVSPSDSDHNDENGDELCLSCNYNQPIDRAAEDEIPIDHIQQQFISAAEKYIKDVDLITRKEKSLLMEIKETLPQETKRALCMVKDSMQRMHASYAKQLDGKLNELTAVLTRVEHLHEEIVEFKQYEDE